MTTNMGLWREVSKIGVGMNQENRKECIIKTRWTERRVLVCRNIYMYKKRDTSKWRGVFHKKHEKDTKNGRNAMHDWRAKMRMEKEHISHERVEKNTASKRDRRNTHSPKTAYQSSPWNPPRTTNAIGAAVVSSPPPY